MCAVPITGWGPRRQAGGGGPHDRRCAHAEVRRGPHGGRLRHRIGARGTDRRARTGRRRSGCRGARVRRHHRRPRVRPPAGGRRWPAVRHGRADQRHPADRRQREPVERAARRRAPRAAPGPPLLRRSGAPRLDARQRLADHRGRPRAGLPPGAAGVRPARPGVRRRSVGDADRGSAAAGRPGAAHGGLPVRGPRRDRRPPRRRSRRLADLHPLPPRLRRRAAHRPRRDSGDRRAGADRAGPGGGVPRPDGGARGRRPGHHAAAARLRRRPPRGGTGRRAAWRGPPGPALHGPPAGGRRRAGARRPHAGRPDGVL